MLHTRRSFAPLALLAALAFLVLSGQPAAADAQTWRGTLTAMSGTTLPATLTLQVNSASYTVNVTTATSLVRKFNGPSTLDEYGIGDDLKVWGALTGTTIDATRIKNYSIQRKGGIFWGTILTVDSAAQSFTMKPAGRNTQTVKTDADTKIFLGFRPGEFADLAVGMRVKVIGLWRKSQSIVEADRVHVKLTELNGTIQTTDCANNLLTVKRSGHDGETWTVTLTAATVIRDRLLSQITCADIKVNDRVSVRGLKTGDTAIRALQVLDKGVKKTPKVLNGEIASIDPTAQTVTFEKKGKSYTASVTSESILVDKTGKLITFDKLAVGHDVSILGTLTGTTVTVNLLIDKDLPEEEED